MYPRDILYKHFAARLDYDLKQSVKIACQNNRQNFFYVISSKLRLCNFIFNCRLKITHLILLHDEAVWFQIPFINPDVMLCWNGWIRIFIYIQTS